MALLGKKLSLQVMQRGICNSKVHCEACRNRASFREKLFGDFELGMIDFPCPENFPFGYKPPKQRIVHAAPPTGWNSPVSGKCCDAPERVL